MYYTSISLFVDTDSQEMDMSLTIIKYGKKNIFGFVFLALS